MRLKPSFRNSAKPALLFSTLVAIFLSGCQASIEPTYKEDQIPQLVKEICQKEYGLNVTTKRIGSTLWIYAPMPKILHKEFGLKEDKIFDDDVAEKMRNILTTIGRVLISSNNSPDFFALLASDVKLGIDYTIIGNTLDIKKSYSGFIPWPEANRRYVIQFNIEPLAIDDYKGAHLKVYNITLADFLAVQIAQRISAQFQDEEFKKYYKIEKIDGKFREGNFIFEYQIPQIVKPPKAIEVRKEVLRIIAYCIKTYDFNDFSSVELTDLATQDKILLNKAAVSSKLAE